MQNSPFVQISLELPGNPARVQTYGYDCQNDLQFHIRLYLYMSGIAKSLDEVLEIADKYTLVAVTNDGNHCLRHVSA
jgi:hypothetical protein